MYEAVLDPISNRADWRGSLELVDDETDDVITDFTGVTIKIEVRDRDRWPILTASTEDGKITFPGNGVVQWLFKASDLSRLFAGTYEIGITMTRNGTTAQLLIGAVPILDGIVHQ